MEDKYHILQSFIMSEMGTEDKKQLLGNMSTAIKKAISLSLLKRLDEECGTDTVETPIVVTKQINRKYSPSYRESLRAGAGFMNCPVSSHIPLADPSHISGSNRKQRLWTTRTFSTNCFVTGNDTVKIVHLYSLHRKALKSNMAKQAVERFIRFSNLLLCLLPQKEKHLQRVLLRHVKTNSLYPNSVLLLHALGIFAEHWNKHENDAELTTDECIRNNLYRSANGYFRHVVQVLFSSLLPMKEKCKEKLKNYLSTTDVLKQKIVPAKAEHPGFSITVFGNFVHGHHIEFQRFDKENSSEGRASVLVEETIPIHVDGEQRLLNVGNAR